MFGIGELRMRQLLTRAFGGAVSSHFLLFVVMARELGRVYVGDLGSGGSKPELEREFERYGALKSVWVARNPPGERPPFFLAPPTTFPASLRVCLHRV